MKFNDVKRFSAYVRTKYHSEYITLAYSQTKMPKRLPPNTETLRIVSKNCYRHILALGLLKRICPGIMQ